MDTRYSFI